MDKGYKEEWDFIGDKNTELCGLGGKKIKALINISITPKQAEAIRLASGDAWRENTCCLASSVNEYSEN